MKFIEIETETPKSFEEIKTFAREKILPGAAQRDREAVFAREIYEEMWKRGWMQACLPREQGGSAMPLSQLVWVVRALAYASAGAATTYMANLLGYSPVTLYGTERLKKEVFGKYAREGGFFAFAMTEAAVGFDVARTQTTAQLTREGFVLNGQKDYISNTTHASHFSVFANLVDAEGRPLGVSCFYVPASSPGLTRSAPMDKLGHREANTAGLHLKNVLIPEHHLIGKPGQGLTILHHCLGRTRTLIGAIALGVCDRASELAINHLKSRVTKGKSLYDKPSLQQLLARFHTDMEAGWLLTQRAASVWTETNSAIKESCMAKMFCGDLAMRFTTEALELVGAQAYVMEHESSRLFRDAKLLEIYEGSSQILELLVARELAVENAANALPKTERKAA